MDAVKSSGYIDIWAIIGVTQWKFGPLEKRPLSECIRILERLYAKNREVKMDDDSDQMVPPTLTFLPRQLPYVSKTLKSLFGPSSLEQQPYTHTTPHPGVFSRSVWGKDNYGMLFKLQHHKLVVWQLFSIP